MITGRRGDRLADAAGRLRGEVPGASVLAVAGDANDADEPTRLVAAALAAFGAAPTILVANSGGPPPGGALDVTDEQIRSAVEGNLLSTVRLVRAVLPGMRNQGWGRICAITSFSVKQPVRGLALSNTARTGLLAWAKTAALDLAGTGITLNLACPGHHDTDRMRELGVDPGTTRMGDAGDFGKIVAFLCSAPASFLTGTALSVDGGSVVGLL